MNNNENKCQCWCVNSLQIFSVLCRILKVMFHSRTEVKHFWNSEVTMPPLIYRNSFKFQFRIDYDL